MHRSNKSDGPKFRPRDLQGLSRLTVEAVRGITDLVESLHLAITQMAAIKGKPDKTRTRGITGLVYRNIRSVTDIVGKNVDPLLDQIAEQVEATNSSETREALIAALNGVLGDHLAARNNPLAIAMQLRQNGLPINPNLLIPVAPSTKLKMLVMVHGLCMNDLQWCRKGHDHGAQLTKNLGLTPLYLHYNSGLHISENGKHFAALLENTRQTIEANHSGQVEFYILAHSMGGLVSRSACHQGERAGHTWPKRLKKLVCLGTPHHGAMLEKGGNLVDVLLEANPYSAPFARLGKLRSSGITDLRYGNLVEADWRDRDRFAMSGDQRQPVPLPKYAQSYAIAATTHHRTGDIAKDLLGDGLVSLNSALGHHANPKLKLAFPTENCWIGLNMNHWDLLDRQEVYQVLQDWFTTPGTAQATNEAGLY